jgi:hypothetical protein
VSHEARPPHATPEHDSPCWLAVFPKVGVRRCCFVRWRQWLSQLHTIQYCCDGLTQGLPSSGQPEQKGPQSALAGSWLDVFVPYAWVMTFVRRTFERRVEATLPGFRRRLRIARVFSSPVLALRSTCSALAVIVTRVRTSAHVHDELRLTDLIVPSYQSMSTINFAYAGWRGFKLDVGPAGIVHLLGRRI